MMTQRLGARRAGSALAAGLAALALGHAPAQASAGDSLWKFFAEFSVKEVKLNQQLGEDAFAIPR